MILTGDALVVYVETAAAGVFVVVNDLHQISVQTTRERSRYAVFQAPPHVLLASAVRALSLQGYLNPGDPGQERLRLMEDTETPVKIRVLPDGTNGVELTVLIHSKSYESSAEEATLQPISYDAEATTSPVGIGTGILI
jgi:hypothetical protein